MAVSSWFSELEAFERSANGSASTLTLRQWLDLAEAWRIHQGLRETGGNRAATARLLGIGRRTLYRKLEKLGLPPRFQKERWPLPERS
jgi:DNA-binding NtrC family response regulator